MLTYYLVMYKNDMVIEITNRSNFFLLLLTVTVKESTVKHSLCKD
jgi:hypothetical protein